jgi:bis(5'-nucleosidyl)-tetraphosphatase
MMNKEGFGNQQSGTQTTGRRSRLVFVNLKNRLHLPGVNDLLAPCIQHLTAGQYKRMLSAWQALPRYHVYGFIHYQQVVSLIAVEQKNQGYGRVLALGVVPTHQRRGLGRRMVVEAFCSMELKELTAEATRDYVGFYEALHFVSEASRQSASGIMIFTCVLTRSALYSAYTHEYSAGAVLFCSRNGERYYVLVTELSGNTGLPKGHVEEGETKEQTALREIQEETGIAARLVPGFGGEIVYPQGRGMLKHFTYFLAEFSPEQEPVSGPDVIAHILPYEQALRKLSFADVRIILRQAEQFLTEQGIRPE